MKKAKRKENYTAMKIKNLLKKVKEKAWAVILTLYALFMSSYTVYADDNVQNSKLVKGTEKLINDITTWLMIFAPVVAGVLIIYFFIRRSAADDMDQKKWNNRIVVAIVSCIGAVIASATLNLIIGYYK
ncbi:Mbov_0395 family pilin-like conjugal transfer protein [Clostridium cadaveris]|jgi:ABC-type molybdate transport system permease subunit